MHGAAREARALVEADRAGQEAVVRPLAAAAIYRDDRAPQQFARIAIAGASQYAAQCFDSACSARRRRGR
jgi:hypothetical protein